MSKFLTSLGGLAAAAGLIACLGAGPASASVARYHESNGAVVSVATPDSVSAAVGSSTQFPVTVSVDGPAGVTIANEKFLTAYGWGDSQWDGLSFAQYGCWGRTLAPGQSCTTTVKFAPTTLGSRTESYMLATGYGNMFGKFTATGLRSRVIGSVTATAPSATLAG